MLSTTPFAQVAKMSEYNIDQVKNYLEIYGKMVHQSSIFKYGVMVKEHKEWIKDTIKRAKTEFPEEIRNKEFKTLMNELEYILKL